MRVVVYSGGFSWQCLTIYGVFGCLWSFVIMHGFFFTSFTSNLCNLFASFRILLFKVNFEYVFMLCLPCSKFISAQTFTQNNLHSGSLKYPYQTWMIRSKDFMFIREVLSERENSKNGHHEILKLFFLRFGLCHVAMFFFLWVGSKIGIQAEHLQRL